MIFFSIKNLILSVFLLLSIFLCIKAVLNLFIACKKRRLDVKAIGLSRGLYTIELIRPIIFFKLFASCLTIAALPQYFIHVAHLSGFSQVVASYLYVMYQTIFILMIIPGGFLVEARNLKRLYILVTLGEVVAWLGLGCVQNFWPIFLIQMVFGCCVPLSSAAEYAYVFKLSSEKHRNMAIALYSNTLRGATISGIFIGSLLVGWLGIQSVFLMASIIVLLTVLYSWLYLPKINPRHDIRIKRIPLKNLNIKAILTKFPNLLSNWDFAKTAIFVGFSVGFLNDGVVLFSIPLLLAHNHFNQVEIGAFLLLFSIGFFISNKYISKRADQLHREGRCIFCGLIGSVFSLIFLSVFSFQHISLTWQFLSWTSLAIGLLLLGFFRGFIFSPSISKISKNPIALKEGKNIALSFYKIFQTLGRILGPILMIHLLIKFTYSPFIYLFISALLLSFSLLFLRHLKREQYVSRQYR